MTSKDAIAEALTLPEGAVFHRCALQVNPHGYDARLEDGVVVEQTTENPERLARAAARDHVRGEDGLQIGDRRPSRSAYHAKKARTSAR